MPEVLIPFMGGIDFIPYAFKLPKKRDWKSDPAPANASA